MKSFFSLLLVCSIWATPIAAATFDLETATIEDINAAFDAKALTAEKLVALYLARIEAYDKKGPAINSIITLNPNALAEARALDAERKAKGPRSPLHGIPVLLKDIVDTYDLPTTGGNIFLANSIPPKDAFITAKFREAGAIILAKVNTSEFALSGRSNGFSSMGGQTLNPHDLARGPAGSSGGSGAALAAWLGTVAIGTDTGGSVRGPCAANGVPGLKPTHGLVSRSGIIPLAESFDTSGPMARSIYDVAATLGVLTGIDPTDPATRKSQGLYYTDYTQFLKKDALSGARFGLLVDFLGVDSEVDKVINSAVATIRAQGGEVVEIKLPAHILTSRQTLFNTIRMTEFKAQLTAYLETLKPGFPRSHTEMRAMAQEYLANPPKMGFANPARWEIFEAEAAEGFTMDDPRYLAAKHQGMAMIRDSIAAILIAEDLDAFIYPTSPVPAQRLDRDYNQPSPPSATNLANFSGFPDAIVPAGLTKDRLPVALSFMGPAFSEPKILAYAYAFEQSTKAMVSPRTTPALPGERFDY